MRPIRNTLVLLLALFSNAYGGVDSAHSFENVVARLAEATPRAIARIGACAVWRPGRCRAKGEVRFCGRQRLCGKKIALDF